MTATSFAPAPATCRETYRDADTGETRVLRYYRRDAVRRGRFVPRFVVAVDYPGCETEVRSFATVEEARECWREMRRAMACRGFERATN